MKGIIIRHKTEKSNFFNFLIILIVSFLFIMYFCLADNSIAYAENTTKIKSSSKKAKKKTFSKERVSATKKNIGYERIDLTTDRHLRDISTYGLATLLRDKEEVSQDYTEKMIDYYLKNCLKGEAESCFNLGVIYEKALGIAQDLDKALFFYQKACELGEQDGCLKVTELKKTIESEKTKETRVLAKIKNGQPAPKVLRSTEERTIKKEDIIKEETQREAKQPPQIVSKAEARAEDKAEDKEMQSKAKVEALDQKEYASKELRLSPVAHKSEEVSKLDKAFHLITKYSATPKDAKTIFKSKPSGALFPEVIKDIKIADNKVISGHGDFSIKIIDPETGKVTNTLRGHLADISAIEVVEDRIISGSYDKTIRIWDLKLGKELITLRGHLEPITTLAVAEDKIISGSYDGNIKVWDLETGKELFTLGGHRDIITSLVVNNGKLISGSFDKTIKIWDLNSGYEILTLKGHDDSISSILVIGDKIISGSYDGQIKVWDINSGRELYTLKGHRGWIKKLLLINNNTIASASGDHTIRLWDLSLRRETVVLRGHRKPISDIKLIDGILISSSEDGTIRLWSLKDRKKVLLIEAHKAPITGLGLIDGKLITSSLDETMRLWNIAEVSKRLLDLENALKSSDPINSYAEFIKKYPSMKEDIRVGDLAYLAALKKNTVEAYEEFVNLYPLHEKVPLAKEKLTNLKLATLKDPAKLYGYAKKLEKDNDLALALKVYQHIVQKYPSSTYSQLANNETKAIKLKLENLDLKRNIEEARKLLAGEQSSEGKSLETEATALRACSKTEQWRTIFISAWDNKNEWRAIEIELVNSRKRLIVHHHRKYGYKLAGVSNWFKSLEEAIIFKCANMR